MIAALDGSFDQLQSKLGVQLAIADTSSFLSDLPFLRSILSERDLQAVNLIGNAIVRDRTTIRRGLLRVLIGSRLGLEPDQIVLQPDRYGKPHLVGHSLPVSCSSSGVIALFGIGSDCAIGVDIERLESSIVTPALRRFTMSAVEEQYLKTLPESEAVRAFYQAWTHKEASLKARGTGLREELREFAVFPRGFVETTELCSASIELGKLSATHIAAVATLRREGRE